jgi:hypothetical protein
MAKKETSEKPDKKNQLQRRALLKKLLRKIDSKKECA